MMFEKNNGINYINSINVGEIAFSSHPRNYNISDYYKTIDKVLNIFDSCAEVISIYQIGSISNPGISDIDLILILESDIPEFSIDYYSYLDPQDKYLLMHGLFAMPLQIFKKIEYLIPTRRLQLLKGQSVILDGTLDENEVGELERIYALEYILVNLFNLMNQFYLKSLKIRNLLCSLNGLVMDFSILNKSLDNRHQSFQASLKHLRENWWDSPDNSTIEFFSLSKDAVFLICRELERASQTMSESEIKRNGGSRSINVGPNGYITPCHSAESSVRIGIGSDPLSVLLTSSKSHFLTRYLSKYILDLTYSIFSISVHLPPHILNILQGHASTETSKVYWARDTVLREYSGFMNRVSKNFGMFDIFRTHQQSIKWNILSRLNSLINTMRFQI